LENQVSKEALVGFGRNSKPLNYVLDDLLPTSAKGHQKQCEIKRNAETALKMSEQQSKADSPGDLTVSKSSEQQSADSSPEEVIESPSPVTISAAEPQVTQPAAATATADATDSQMIEILLTSAVNRKPELPDLGVGKAMSPSPAIPKVSMAKSTIAELSNSDSTFEPNHIIQPATHEFRSVSTVNASFHVPPPSAQRLAVGIAYAGPPSSQELAE
jgi:hypothetical protein